MRPGTSTSPTPQTTWWRWWQRAACSSSCPLGLASTTVGDIYTVAGTGTACSTHTPAGCGYTSGGVAQPATSANLDAPSGVATDSSGNLYVADKTDNMVALVADTACVSSCVLGLGATTIGDIYPVAGTGTAAYWGDGGSASTTTVDAPGDVAVDSSGDVFIADTTNNRVRMVPASSGTYFGQGMTAGDIYTVAGTGTAVLDPHAGRLRISHHRRSGDLGDPGRARRCGGRLVGEPLHRRHDRSDGGDGGPGRRARRRARSGWPRRWRGTPM